MDFFKEAFFYSVFSFFNEFTPTGENTHEVQGLDDDETWKMVANKYGYHFRQLLILWIRHPALLVFSLFRYAIAFNSRSSLSVASLYHYTSCLESV